MMMQKISYILTIVFMGLMFPVLAKQGAPSVPEITLGRPDAPVTIIEYSSLTCTHCAEFHRTTLPELKKKYIDTGKVRIVFRPFPLDEYALKAAAVVASFPQMRQYDIMSKIFDNQEKWMGEKSFVTEIAKLAAMSDKECENCMNRKDLQDQILEARLAAMNKYRIEATPTFLIQGKKFEEELSLEEIEEILNPKA